MRKEVKLVTAAGIQPHVHCRGITVRRLVTRTREGAQKVMLGIMSMEPRSEEHRFTNPDKEEAYYVVKGTITIQWDNNRLDAKEGQAVFLPPGFRYSESNRTDGPALVVYALAPPLE